MNGQLVFWLPCAGLLYVWLHGCHSCALEYHSVWAGGGGARRRADALPLRRPRLHRPHELALARLPPLTARAHAPGWLLAPAGGKERRCYCLPCLWRPLRRYNVGVCSCSAFGTAAHGPALFCVALRWQMEQPSRDAACSHPSGSCPAPPPTPHPHPTPTPPPITHPTYTLIKTLVPNPTNA